MYVRYNSRNRNTAFRIVPSLLVHIQRIPDPLPSGPYARMGIYGGKKLDDMEHKPSLVFWHLLPRTERRVL